MSNSLQVIKQGFKLLMESGRFDRVLEKVNIIAAEGGNLQAELEVCQEHTNRGGSLHGGFTATLVDQMSTLALLTHADENLAAGVSVELNVSFLAAANVGDLILIEASTLRKGRNLAYLNVDIMKKDGRKLIAKATHVKFIGGCGPASTSVNKL